MALLPFELSVHLVSALGEQKQSSQEEDEVTARYLLRPHIEERCSELDDPGDRKQKEDSHEHRESKAKTACFLALLARQLAGKNGDEYNVVDAEYDLECSESGERNPGLRVAYPVHSIVVEETGLLEDSEMSEDVPKDDEDDDAHTATAASQLSSAVACGNSTQQLAHQFSGIKVRVAHGESHDSYRGAGVSSDEGFQPQSSRITLRPQQAR